MMTLWPSWGNARDVKTLARQIINRAWECGFPVEGNEDVELTLSMSEVLDIVTTRIKEQADRVRNVAGSLAGPGPLGPSGPPKQTACAPPPSRNLPLAQTTTAETQRQEPNQRQNPGPPPNAAQDQGEQRDDGVSDADWKQLQRDKATASQRLQDEKERMKEAQVQAKFVANDKLGL